MRQVTGTEQKISEMTRCLGVLKDAFLNRAVIHAAVVMTRMFEAVEALGKLGTAAS